VEPGSFQLTIGRSYSDQRLTTDLAVGAAG
jgi:hypothetical protein